MSTSISPGRAVDDSYTPTQLKILDVLADGKAHSAREIAAKCGMDLDSNIRMHLTNIRKRLRKAGEDISTEVAFGLVWHRWCKSFSID